MQSKNSQRWLLLAALLIVVLAGTACTETPDNTVETEEPSDPADTPPDEADEGDQTDGEGEPMTVDYARAAVDREAAPAVDPGDLAELAAGNTTFALELHHAIAQGDENLIYSPYSISLALAMAFAGAETNTEHQMADTLHFTLTEDRLHPAFNALDQQLTALDQGDLPEEAQPFRLNIANAIWGQSGYPFEDPYLETLARNYGAGLRLLDFTGDAESARQTINAWVEDETEERIKDLIPAGALDAFTRLVLTNAIYFYGAWASQFDVENTADGTFTLLDGSTVETPMMRQASSFGYAINDEYQAINLPYDGNQVSMAVIMPAEGQFEAFEQGLDAEQLEGILGSFQYGEVDLSMPSFEFESEFGLSDVLAALGMSDAFSDQAADFSGITAAEQLVISDVLHKAFVKVDEEGTEAAAATAIIFRATAIAEPPVPLAVDHPFLFIIYEHSTGSILFIGRVTNPAS